LLKKLEGKEEKFTSKKFVSRNKFIPSKLRKYLGQNYFYDFPFMEKICFNSKEIFSFFE